MQAPALQGKYSSLPRPGPFRPTGFQAIALPCQRNATRNGRSGFKCMAAEAEKQTGIWPLVKNRQLR